MRKKLFFLLLMLIFIPFLNIAKPKFKTKYNAVNKKSKKEITMVFVGDLMTHPFLVQSLDADKSTLMHMKDTLRGDIVFANLEFTVDTNKKALPYPMFNGTREYLKYFTEFFNTFSVANNHVYDQGAKAQNEMLNFLEEDNAIYVGGNTNTPHTKPLITNINGVDLFFTAYSTIDNALYKTRKESPDGYKYYMNFYPKKEELITNIINDLKNVKDKTLKIVSLHYGLEYTTKPNKTEKELLESIIETGVDIVVAHHSHVPREAVWYKGTNYSGVIIYSLGNFLANHKSKFDYIDIGVTLTLRVNNKKEYLFSYNPTYIYYYYTKEGKRARVIPILKNPKDELPFTNQYKYTQTDINKIKNGYKLVTEFYESMSSFTQGITNRNIIKAK